MIGTKLRFFSERVFGAWVNGTVVKVTPSTVVIAAEYFGARWKECRPLSTEFYRPIDHPQRGEPFLLVGELSAK